MFSKTNVVITIFLDFRENFRDKLVISLKTFIEFESEIQTFLHFFDKKKYF
jgi:hypothetical protein